MYSHHRWTKIKNHIAGKKKKSLLNFFLLSAVSELRSLPGFIPWCPCSVHRPSRSRNSHLYTAHFSSNKFSSRACTWMRGSPQRGWQAACGQQPACAGAPGKWGTSYFPARQDAGRHGVEGNGKQGGRCNTACSLCSSFPWKYCLFDLRSKIIHLCHLLPSRAAENFPCCNAKPEAAKHNEACEDLNSFSQAQSTLMPTSEAIQAVSELRAMGSDISADEQYFNPLSLLVGVMLCHGLSRPVFLTSAT